VLVIIDPRLTATELKPVAGFSFPSTHLGFRPTFASKTVCCQDTNHFPTRPKFEPMTKTR